MFVQRSLKNLKDHPEIADDKFKDHNSILS